MWAKDFRSIRYPESVVQAQEVIFVQFLAETIKLQKIETEFEHQIDLSNQAPGLYIIQIAAGEYRSIHKIIIK